MQEIMPFFELTSYRILLFYLQGQGQKIPDMLITMKKMYLWPGGPGEETGGTAGQQEGGNDASAGGERTRSEDDGGEQQAVEKQ